KFAGSGSISTMPNRCGSAASDMAGCSVQNRAEAETQYEEEKMERKTAVVTSEEVAVALAKVRTMTSEEEKVVRMRHGAKVSVEAPLARAAGDNAELADELLVIEMQLMRAMRARNTVAPTPMRSAGKDKIVRMLRRKK